MSVRALFLLVLSATAVSAAEPKPYEPLGATSRPKVPAQWNRYSDYRQATELLKALAEAHPARAKLVSLGKSHGGREMWVLTVTAFDHGGDRTKPAFWIDGGIHANEIQGTEAALYTAWYLLEMYERSPAVKRLLDSRAFYILPMLSPDSRDAHMYEPNSTHSPRAGQRPVDDDLDGLVDEDKPDDLDGDGTIAQMRIRDPNGRWKSHPDYPNLMVRCRDDEPGQYRLIDTEGLDNDGDGKIDEDGNGYYDPNRDWGWDWQPKYVQRGAYRYPFSILENRMAADFISDHNNIAGAQTFHNTGGMILRGPGVKSADFEPRDAAVLDAIGKTGESMLPGYRSMAIGRDLYQVYGGEIDWLYQCRGILAFTNEMFTAWNLFRRASGSGPFGKDEDFHAFDKLLLLGDGVIPWHEVDHPQYGKVEVGGLKKNWGRQPPSFLLEEECHRNMAFTLYHAEQMPKIEVQEIRVRPVDGGLNEVTAVVANRRMMATRAAVDVKHNLTPADVVTLSGRDVRVVAGLWDENPFFEHANFQRRKPEQLRIPAVPGMGAVYARWLVAGSGPYRVAVTSCKGGSCERVHP